MFHNSWWSLVRYDENARPHIDRELLRRVAHYARPYWRDILTMLALIISISVLELVPPLLYRDLFDTVLPTGDVRRLNWLALGMVGIPLLTGLLGVAQRYFSARVGEGIIFDLRQQMFEHLQRMPLRFFTHTKAGDIISRFSNDVVGAQNAITGTIPNIITNIVILISTLAIMFSLEWRLTLLAVVVVPLFLMPARRVARILRRIRRERMHLNAELSNRINETLSINGALLVKIFGRQQDEIARFRAINQGLAETGIRAALVGRWFFVGIGLASAIGTALVYWVGGYLALNQAISPGTIVAFVAYITRLYGPIGALSNVQVEFATSLVSFERVFEYLDLPVEIEDAPNAIHLPDVQGHIRFEHVSFRYDTLPGGETAPQGREWALHDISFEIQPGQLVAIVGPSGAGKTTITYLLPRLYDVTEGRITIDGHDVRQIAQASLARHIGIVMQETYLFHDTIRANLLYANPHADDDALIAACRAANIHDFIMSLPEGYDTVVGERGYRLSGGEKQRLAIARLILKNPRILILDEATAHLDSQNEALIQAALEPLFEGRTSLVIAHRLSTILKADTILVLNEGRLVEQGTHEELLARGGLYAHLYETQFQAETTNPTG